MARDSFCFQVKNCQLNNQHVVRTCYRPKDQILLIAEPRTWAYPSNRWLIWQPLRTQRASPGIFLDIFYGLVANLAPRISLSPVVFVKPLLLGCIINLINIMGIDASSANLPRAGPNA